jgi:hypothetical protein
MVANNIALTRVQSDALQQLRELLHGKDIGNILVGPDDLSIEYTGQCFPLSQVLRMDVPRGISRPVPCGITIVPINTGFQVVTTDFPHSYREVRFRVTE